MLLFFRFLMIFVGAFYKIYGRLFERKPLFQRDENLDFEFAFVVKKKKNSKQTELIIKNCPKLFFRISIERRLHRILKKMGFNSELQTGNLEFDINHYVESDHSSFKRALKHNQELQSTILQLRKLGFETIVSLGDGTIKILSHLNSSESPDNEVIRLAKKIQDNLNQIRIFKGENDPFVLKVLCFEVFYYAIGFYGISTYIAHSFDDGLYQLDPWKLTLRGAYYGSLCLIAWISISFTILKNSSRAPVFFGEVFFGMVVCLVFGGSQIMIDLNEVLDNSTPVYEKAYLVEKYTKTSRSGRRSNTSYYLKLQFQNNNFNIQDTLRVNVINYHNLHEGMGVEFTIRKGHFDAPYIVSMKSVPYEQMQIKTKTIDHSELKILASWSPESNLDFDGQVEWVEEYYPDKKQLRQKEPFVSGKRQGVGEYWHQNGKVYGYIPWVNGQKHGKFKLYKDDGTLDQDLSYKEGKPHGLLTWYKRDGSIYTQAIYRNGEVLESNLSRIQDLNLDLKP